MCVSKLGAYIKISHPGQVLKKVGPRTHSSILNHPPPKKKDITHQTSQFIQLHGVVSRFFSIFGWHLDIPWHQNTFRPFLGRTKTGSFITNPLCPLSFCWSENVDPQPSCRCWAHVSLDFQGSRILIGWSASWDLALVVLAPGTSQKTHDLNRSGNGTVG